MALHTAHNLATRFMPVFRNKGNSTYIPALHKVKHGGLRAPCQGPSIHLLTKITHTLFLMESPFTMLVTEKDLSEDTTSSSHATIPAQAITYCLKISVCPTTRFSTTTCLLLMNTTTLVGLLQTASSHKTAYAFTYSYPTRLNTPTILRPHLPTLCVSEP